MNEFFSTSNRSLFYVVGTVLGILLFYVILQTTLKRLGKNPKYLIPSNAVRRVSDPVLLMLLSILVRLPVLRQLFGFSDHAYWFKKASTLLFIFSATWLTLNLLKLVKQHVLKKYDVGAADNLKARKITTQFNILERIIIFIVVFLAVGIALVSFDEIREIGVSVFASAGVAGIIIGFSAQKMIATFLAGIQIAVAQPIKLDDVVIVEGEWGRIEEITLTYVVVKIWDKRRLIVPTTYFIERPFQNWTKTSADILGTVFLYTDYQVPIDAIRSELTDILKNTSLWDGEVNVVQITDSKANYVEIRALMSAKDSPTAWDLRVHVREKLIQFLQQNYPESIAHTRLWLRDKQKERSMDA
ncbi:Small-conductance mechanosensitive channel [Croceitalea dokdonensis DOKDO 023]|uniref:Small-conductance mechanosensitive channel n=1 Tax=Croceitalea dokdonensis DOKDO 023 TaxID=1300341 RepID=A0A0P7AW26_9FLAO|nr:mechanosensitive ion channel domain-containing protein [Croceitalea dokdonensis]KPM32144.1 Small-conductance mechanosensitive channel [Croceitalea dokdonensis DOKDO 023]